MIREPLVSIATITAAVTALIALYVAFGGTLTQDQTSAILGIVAVAAPLTVAVFTRPKVTPVADPVSNEGERLVPASTRSVSRTVEA